MRQTPHVETHFTASESVRDIVIGMSDGLTVPFALAAGLSGAVESSSIIVTAGLAEVAAGAIARGLGGYLAARTDAEHFASGRAREEREAEEFPEKKSAEVAGVLRSYGLDEEKVALVVDSIRADKGRWVDFMMRFELGHDEPDPKRAGRSARTIAVSYAAGGLVPPAPYFIFSSAHSALIGSVVVTLLALFCVRVRQGAIHHDPALPQRVANRHRGRAGRDGGVCHRQGNRVVTVPSSTFFRRVCPGATVACVTGPPLPRRIATRLAQSRRRVRSVSNERAYTGTTTPRVRPHCRGDNGVNRKKSEDGGQYMTAR
jgi:VIT1/CCC1 family predicted Fe2+/Mn2+ transporter